MVLFSFIFRCVTDAHVQIPPILVERGITGQWDIWHFVKNLLKKLNAVSFSVDSLLCVQ